MALNLSDPRAISHFMAVQAACGFGFRNPVYRAALAGEFQLIELLPKARLQSEALWKDRPPTLIVLGDDAGISDGPRDFPQARRIFAWAERVMVHAAGGEERHYEAAAEATRLRQRVALVETRTAQEPAWLALLEDEQGRRIKAGRPLLPVLLIQVPPNKPAYPIVEPAA